MDPLLQKLPKIAHFEDLRKVRNELFSVNDSLKDLSKLLRKELLNFDAVLSSACNETVAAKRALIDQKSNELKAGPVVFLTKYALSEDDLARAKKDIQVIKTKIEEIRALVGELKEKERFALFDSALIKANESLLKEHDVELSCGGQWPRKIGDRFEAFDQRPDIDLYMQVNGEWVHIDIIYMRQMPQEPEKLKTISQLAQDMVAKATQHLEAMKNAKIHISSSGSKLDLSGVEKEVLIDEKGYIRINGLRIVNKNSEGKYKPIKASDIRSHTIMRVQKLPNGIFNMTDDFDPIRTDGIEGIFCPVNEALEISQENIIEERQFDSKEVEKYIPIQRTLPRE
jgi:hypothetical protein